MPDIFISYSRKNKIRVEKLAHSLEEEGFDVWWDDDLEPGDKFRKVIKKKIDNAVSVIVIWTEQSIDSDWVKQEASRAHEKGALIPVLLDPITPPMPFGELHNADLTSWTGKIDDPYFQLLINLLRKKIQEHATTSNSKSISALSNIQEHNEKSNMEEISSSHENTHTILQKIQLQVDKIGKKSLLGIGTVVMTIFGLIGAYLDVETVISRFHAELPELNISYVPMRELSPNESFDVEYEVPKIGHFSIWQQSPDDVITRIIPSVKNEYESSYPTSKTEYKILTRHIEDIGESYFILLWTPMKPDHLGREQVFSKKSFDDAVKKLKKLRIAKTRSVSIIQ